MSPAVRGRFALMLSAVVGCTTLQIEPPARTTLPLPSGGGLDIDVESIVLSDDMLVDEATAQSKLAFQVVVHNSGGIGTWIDPRASRLVVRVAGQADQTMTPVASGWGDLPSNQPPRQALEIQLRPQETQRAWLMFEVPPAARPPSPARPQLILVFDADGQASPITVAGPSGPRWFEPATGPLRIAVSEAVVAAPSTVADTLGLTVDYGPLVRLSAGAVYGRHDGHGENGLSATLQLNGPWSLQPAPRVRLTAFVSGELFTLMRSSYTARYPGEGTDLTGAAAGLQIGFGMLRPPNADHLPIAYSWLIQPLTLRAGYVRWWGDVDNVGMGSRGRAGFLAGVTLWFGP